MNNPYNWSGARPSVVIQRTEEASILAKLQQGEGLIVMAGHGMGKSVLLCRLEEKIKHAGALPIRIPQPPGEASFQSYLSKVSRSLGFTESFDDAIDLFEAYFARTDANSMIILLL